VRNTHGNRYFDADEHPDSHSDGNGNRYSNSDCDSHVNADGVADLYTG
jgi:hypothetical protein